MFNIYDISAGWMDISFGERKTEDSDTSDVFSLSYIDDVKDEFDNLFNLKGDETKKYEFDLEGTVLEVETSLDNDYIVISCDHKYSDDKPSVYKYFFKYEDFIRSYVKEIETYKKDYIKNFVYGDDEKGAWNNKDYIELQKKGGILSD